MSLQAAEKTNDDAESLDQSLAQTSSVSIPLSTDASSDATVIISITQCHYARWSLLFAYLDMELCLVSL